MPAADVLGGGAKPTGDLGLGEPLLEQPPSAQAALPGCLGAPSPGGRCASTGSGGGCCACRHEHHAPLTARLDRGNHFILRDSVARSGRWEAEAGKRRACDGRGSRARLVASVCLLQDWMTAAATAPCGVGLAAAWMDHEG